MLQPLTASEMKEFEKYACDNFDITVDEMMQNAGRAIFNVVMNEVGPSRVLVVVGKGNNGGDALVTARLLKEKGIKVEIFKVGSDISFMNHEFDLIIDGIFGFSLKGDPRPPADKIIEQILCSSVPVLSIDVPSGLDCETGRLMDPAVRATYTVTLGMPKIGLDKCKDNVGKLYLGDVGIPQKAYQKLGIYTPIFLGKSYISLN
jgi:NAD(P)H-hydrate repair Nnr-like enzyme with NAD(P)H-hydrate epimerase domain